MALIKCPECGKDVSDKAEVCIHCGYPLKAETNQKESDERPYTKCPKCGAKNEEGVKTCKVCHHVYTDSEYIIITPEKRNNTLAEIQNNNVHEFHGVYRYSFFKGKQEVYCPRCHSQNCSHYKEQRVIPGKTKTKYTANLNPLKPFTLVNKKEKVIRQDQVVTDNKFMCNECGKIFY